MSEQLQCCVVSPTRPSGRRGIAHALLISLCVHAALVGVFWRYIATHPQPASRELHVELSTAAQPASEIVSARTAVAPGRNSSESKFEMPAQPRARAHVAAVAHPVAHPADLAESNSGQSSAAHGDELPPQLEARESQHGVVSIDVQVLEWLARYRTYPLAARRARIEGVVQLRVTLMPDGRLVDARVERSSGHPILDAAALDLLARAAPLPSDFGSARNERIELELPIVYRMRPTST